MLRLYTKNEVNSIFSFIPSRTLRSWVEGGLVGWAGEKTDGRGVHRSFTIGNLYQIAIVAELASLHFPLEKIRHLMDQYFKEEKHGRPGLIELLKRLLIISIATIEKKERIPHIRTATISIEDAGQLLPKFLDPVVDLTHTEQVEGEKVLWRRGKKLPNPTAFIVVNLPEIVEKVHYFIEKAELG
jgi:DNA-binding transcriptional MerR regulator